MRKAVWTISAVLAAVLAAVLVFCGVQHLSAEYPTQLYGALEPQKITGQYLLRRSASQKDVLPVFGSSELKTTDICTHPANFFSEHDCGFTPDLIGRGSCQSLVHAMAIAASGDLLTDRKIVLITAPQSYVPEGIAPDLFFANFSEQQMLSILRDPQLSDGIKDYFSRRVQELRKSYAGQTGTELQTDTAAGLLTAARCRSDAFSSAALQPYAYLSSFLLDLKDRTDSAKLMGKYGNKPAAFKTAAVDWDAETDAAMEQAAQMVTNNDYFMQDGYYSTYIGSRLSSLAGKDAGVSYDESPEYDDLRCLMEVCSEKHIRVLFVHVPIHAKWYDYTGLSAEKRKNYYEKVENIVQQYDNVTLLDLTDSEYEPYFMCDTMHLGWKGWLSVDRAIVEFWGKN